jgi:HEAT repeat protein
MKTKAILWLTVCLITATCRADLPLLKQQLRMPAIVLLSTPESWVQLYRLSQRSPQPLSDVLEQYLQACERGEYLEWIGQREADNLPSRRAYALMRLGDIGGEESIAALQRFIEHRLQQGDLYALWDSIAARVTIERIQARLKGRDAYIAEMIRWARGDFTPWQEQRLTRWNRLSEIQANVETPYRKRMAVRVLGMLKAREAVPTLLELCEKSEVWWGAHQALAEIGDRRALEVIGRGLRTLDPARALDLLPLEPGQVDPAWAYWQMRTKGMNLEQTVNAMVSALAGNDARQGVVEILTLMGRQVVPYLLKALAQPPGPDVDNAQFAVIRVLGNLRAPEAVEPLRQLLRESPSLAVKMACAWALGKIGDPCVIPDLVVLLWDENSSLRWEAIMALGEMKHPQAIPPLLKVLREHPNEFTRTHAVSALESSGMRWLVPILEYRRMVEPSPLVQEYLADAVITLKQRR